MIEQLVDINTFDNNIVTISPYFKDNLERLTKSINVILTDLKGEILIEQQNADFIDITSQPKGYYIAFIIDLNGKLIRKIRVIKR